MIKTHTYKLYQNKSYEKKFDRWIGICRMVYNLAKETKEYAYKTRGVTISNFDLHKQLTELRREYSFISEVDQSALETSITKLDNAYKKFFKGSGYPKWAKKHKFNSFETRQTVTQNAKGFKVGKFGIVKVFNNTKINGKIKRARLIRKADGLYVQIIFEDFSKKLKNNENQVVALDMGIKYFTVSSDGEFINNPKHLFKYLAELRIENRKLSRMKKGGSNWRKQVVVLKKLYLKISNTRKDFLHKTSSYFANNYENVICENLNIAGMSKNKRLSKHILDCGWSVFFWQLSYKTNLIKVKAKHTSQRCSECGHTCKENRATQSLFECIECGHSENADLQATKNIMKLGTQLLHANVVDCDKRSARILI